MIKLWPGPMACRFFFANSIIAESVPLQRMRHLPDASQNASPNFIPGTAETSVSWISSIVLMKWLWPRMKLVGPGFSILTVTSSISAAEVILRCSNHITIKASSESDDMYGSIDQVVDRIARKMRKVHTRLMRKGEVRRHSIRTGPSEIRAFYYYRTDPAKDVVPPRMLVIAVEQFFDISRVHRSPHPSPGGKQKLLPGMRSDGVPKHRAVRAFSQPVFGALLLISPSRRQVIYG